MFIISRFQISVVQVFEEIFINLSREDSLSNLIKSIVFSLVMSVDQDNVELIL